MGERRAGDHLQRHPDRPWLLDGARVMSAVLIRGGRRLRDRPIEICAARLKWTIVVLRDGRRSRPSHADVAQLVAHHLAKVRVAGSNPVIRSRVQSHQRPRWSGRVVRQRPAKPCTRVRFPSPPPSMTKARLAQRESASLTRKRSLVQSQYRALAPLQVRGGFWCASNRLAPHMHHMLYPPGNLERRRLRPEATSRAHPSCQTA
jgi:hypothetical protein